MGIYDWEQTIDRDIIINAEIRLKNDNILHSHDLSDSIDYEEIVNKIKSLAKSKFALVEDFTNEVANIIISYDNVEKTTVEVDKVGAVEKLESFSILITKEK